jgi:hypothetical protein
VRSEISLQETEAGPAFFTDSGDSQAELMRLLALGPREL